MSAGHIAASDGMELPVKTAVVVLWRLR
ncbi:hypothetical protein E2C01_057321 [Portunus trituberculatus]|uniref:Uncharacterized protein n=1 Tax=Portunus trituberculatus TaxID=210409 RepID=A0A5B7H1J8_PORTR|nr:hypothetical protein [Portunus trituberculatus]